MKGAIHDFVSSSCTSGKKGIRAERHCEPRPAPRNESSSHEGSGLGGLLTSSPMLTAAQASMAVSSGSGAAVATTPEGGSPTLPSSSEAVSSDAAIDILSTDAAVRPVGQNQQNHPETGRDVRCMRRSVGTYPAERLLLSPSDLPKRQPVVLCSSQRDQHGWRQRMPILSE